jgi:citrate synthase
MSRKEPKPIIRLGLDSVAAVESAICYIDGKKGILRYRGHDIASLAGKRSYEAVAWLLLNGKLPSAPEERVFAADLARRRQLPPLLLDILRKLPKGAGLMDVLRTSSSVLGILDTRKDDLERAKDAIARFPAIVAAYERLNAGKQPVPPDPGLGHAADFLHMRTGEKPHDDDARTFDACLVLHAEHGINASTFSARVTVSTLSDFYSGLTSAIGTLKGPLHGGANMQVLRMLQEIGEPGKADAWVAAKLAAHQRIMGFGHRVYRTTDPRATVLRGFSKRLAERRKDPRWYALSEAVREAVWRQKRLYPNVDFFSASTYQYLGLPASLYPALFAIARVAGWSAHLLEQYANNRLLRPRAVYTGPEAKGKKILLGG